MMDEIKKVLLFGVGAVASTYEKATEVVDDLVKKGKITIDEGKELGEELKRTFKEKTKEKEELSNTARDNISNIEASNYVLRDEYEMLKARVYKLEKLINKEDEK
jgi:polyhydroxyalkanoate synthesis regulator phasin